MKNIYFIIISIFVFYAKVGAFNWKPFFLKTDDEKNEYFQQFFNKTFENCCIESPEFEKEACHLFAATLTCRIGDEKRCDEFKLIQRSKPAEYKELMKLINKKMARQQCKQKYQGV